MTRSFFFSLSYNPYRDRPPPLLQQSHDNMNTAYATTMTCDWPIAKVPKDEGEGRRGRAQTTWIVVWAHSKSLIYFLWFLLVLIRCFYIFLYRKVYYELLRVTHTTDDEHWTPIGCWMRVMAGEGGPKWQPKRRVLSFGLIVSLSSLLFIVILLIRYFTSFFIECRGTTAPHNAHASTDNHAHYGRRSTIDKWRWMREGEGPNDA